jgi:transcriptional regulator with XRE-family HTH domain
MAASTGRGRRGRRGSDNVDNHIGRRLRDRRRTLGLSQAQLAARMGFTPPQINRYEHGTTRLSAAGLWRAAEVLDVPPSYFFDGLGERADDQEVEALDALAVKITRYLRILTPDVRDKLIGFIASLARR